MAQGSGIETVTPADAGRGFLSPSRLDDPSKLTRQYEMLVRQRRVTENHWKLYLAFYKGRQWTYYNPKSRRIEQIPVDVGDKPRNRVRITANMIMPGAHELLAKYTKTKPVMHATPGSASDRDLKAAQFSEDLLEYWWKHLLMDDMRAEVTLWSIICGQGYVEPCWNPHAGTQQTYLVGPDGQPVVDPQMVELFKAELNARNVQPREQIVYLGDVECRVRSPFDVYGDPTVRNWSECKWVYSVSHLDPDTIKSLYGVTLQPNAVNASPDVTLPLSNAESAQEMTVRKVITAHYQPQPGVPQGRIVTWSPGHRDMLDDKKWDLPTHDLPFVKFGGIRVPGEIYDESVVGQVIPLQKELNRTISQIVQHKNLTINPQWKAPSGSIITQRNNESGAIWEYRPVAGLAPEPIMPPPLQSYIFQLLENQRQRMNDIMGNADVLQGQVPPNVEAGVAIDLLQEMATDRQAPTILLQETSLAQLGRQLLGLAKTYYTEPRKLKIGGSGSAVKVKEFTHADITGDVDVRVEAGSSLPRTRAGRQARLEWLMANQMIRPDQALRYADVADLVGAQAVVELDEDEAMREHDLFVSGQPFNQVAMAQAQSAVQQGMNPDTGQPLQAPEEAQQVMQMAGFKPSMFQNHQIHMDVHTRLMKSVEFQAWPVERQQLLVQHVGEHYQILVSFPAQVQPQAPRVAYQIKSTIPPAPAAAILQRSGINVQAEEMTEPSMDTWVSDSVDKPNAEGDPQAASPAGAAREQAQAQQAQAQAEQAEQQNQLAAEQHDQQLRHAEAEHSMKVQALKARADAAREQIRQRARVRS